VRLLSVVAGLVIALVLATACQPLSPFAAIVNGTRISQHDLDRELTAFRHNTAFVTSYAQSAASQGQTGVGVLDTATAGGVYTQSFVAALLGLDIQSAVIHAEVVRRKIEPDPTAVTSAATAAAAAQQVGGPTIFGVFPTWLQQLFEEHQAEEDALGRSLGVQPITQAAIQQYYDQNQPQFITSQCVSHILVKTQAEAAGLLAQIQGGAPFASVAVNSTDASTASKGGSLGCQAPSTGSDPVDLDQAFVQAATTAALNKVTGPVQLSTGWDLLIVTARTIQPLDANMAQAITQQLQQQSSTLLNQFFQQAATTLKVELNPMYGHWDNQQLAVVPPTAPDPAKSGMPTTSSPPSTAPPALPASPPTTTSTP
jgi:hypothetical protein